MTNNMEKNDLRCLPRFFAKGACVLAVAGILCGTLNGCSGFWTMRWQW